MLFSIHSSFRNWAFKVWTTLVVPELGTISLAELRELKFSLEKRQAWGPAGECARSYTIYHFHQRSFLPSQEGQVESLCGWSSGVLLPRRSGSSRGMPTHDVGVANQWYHENRMLVNERKHQGLVLGDKDYGFPSQPGHVRDFWNGNRL